MKSEEEIRRRRSLVTRQRAAMLALILGGGQVLLIRTRGEELGWHTVTLVVTCLFLFFTAFIFGGSLKGDDPS